MKKKTITKLFAVRLPVDMIANIEVLADKLDVTVSDAVRLSIKNALRYYLAAETKKEYQNTTETKTSLKTALEEERTAYIFTDEEIKAHKERKRR